MPALIPLTALACTITVFAIVTYYLRPHWLFRSPPQSPSNAIHVQELLARSDLENETLSMIWPVGWPHEEPEEPLGVTGAHQVMRSHRSCTVEGCPRKAAAFRLLVDAGRIVPDSRSERWAGR